MTKSIRRNDSNYSTRYEVTIDKDHKYYGAALLQIAEYDQFTAINAVKFLGKTTRCSFVINTGIGIYLRYRSETNPTCHSEFSFHFNQNNLEELEELNKRMEHVFIVLICDEAKGICCIPYEMFCDLVDKRRKAKDEIENIYTILVTAQARQSFHVYINCPGKRNTIISGKHVVPRTTFPKCLFG